MEWTDEGIVLSVRAHGETAALGEFLTREHGRHMGLVHGGRSRKLRPVLQTGNHVDLAWKARLAEHLGHVGIELRRGYAAEAMEDVEGLSGLAALCAMARLLPERDPHPALYEVMLFVLGFLDDPTVWPALYVRFELMLLDELGFGLDLRSCAATGGNDQLIYVSPKSGRAVSASAGEPYKDRLLALPQFLVPGQGRALARGDLETGLALTGHFLAERVLAPRQIEMPEARRRAVELIARRERGA